MTHVRRLSPADIDAYVTLRREMLLDSPWAFGASPGQDRGGDADHLRTAILSDEYALIGAFDDGGSSTTPVLVAAAGVLRETGLKFRHIATIWGVYVTPTQRRKGAGRLVVAAAIDAARTWQQSGVARVRLGVSANATAAQRLYESLGFIAWGVEPDCIRVDGASFDEIYMSLRL